MKNDTRVWAIAIVLAMVGCTPTTSTLPSEGASSDAMRAELALGRLDTRAGDPDAELVRVRRFAIAERDGVFPPGGAGVRLFALHRIALRLAQTEAERATAMAKLREDEPLLLTLAAEEGGPFVLALAAYDAELYRRHPEATTEALEHCLSRESVPDEETDAWRQWDLAAFAQTLPPALYVRLYAEDLVVEPGPLVDAPTRQLGAFGVHALHKLIELRLHEGDLPAADAAAARLLEIDPTATRIGLLRLSIARGEPLHILRQEGAYQRALGELVGPTDVMRLPAVSLGLAFERVSDQYARPLVLPLLSHEDESVRALALDVACELGLHTECPPPPAQTEAGRMARADDDARALRRRPARRSSRDDCWGATLVNTYESDPAWRDFFACAEAVGNDEPPDYVFESLYHVRLPFAPRALALLDRLEGTRTSLAAPYVQMRMRIAFETGDLERARRTLSSRGVLLGNDERIAWTLALEDAAYFAAHPESSEGSPLPPSSGREGWASARDDSLDAVFRDVVQTLDARGCPPESFDDETTAEPVLDGRLLVAYERTADAYDANDIEAAARIRGRIAGHLASVDAAHMLGMSALRLIRVGKLTMARSFAERVHALASGTYTDRLVRFALARAAEEMDAVRRDARVLIAIEPGLVEVLGGYADVTREPTVNDEVEDDIDDARAEPLVCGVGLPTRSTLAATGATAPTLALAAELIDVMHDRDDGIAAQDAFRFERLMRGASRDEATNALRCIAGGSVFAPDADADYSLPAAVSAGVPHDAFSERARLVADACGRVSATRHTPALLHAWAMALRSDPSPSRAMLEAFVRATRASESRHVLRTHIASLVRLERYVEAREAWKRATHFTCVDGTTPSLFGMREVQHLAPELGLLSIELLERSNAESALMREDWVRFDDFEGVEPIHALIASERRRGILDRFSAHALLGSSLEASDFAALLSRNPRSIVVRIGAVERAPRERICGTRAACAAMAREVIASDPASPFLALVAATYFVDTNDVAEARRIIVRALEANPEDRGLRAFLASRCDVEEDSPPASDATCARAVACCDTYLDEAGDEIDGFDSAEACAGVRRAEARGRAGEVACAAAIDAWTETLDAVEGDVPDTCFVQ